MIQQNDYLAVQHIRVRINHNIISTVNLVQGDTAREFHFSLMIISYRKIQKLEFM